MADPTPISLDLNLTGTHVLITGGAGLIGRSVVSHFLAANAQVTSLDISYPSSPNRPVPNLLELHADITSPASLSDAWTTAVSAFGTVATAIALASLDLSVLPQTESLADQDPATWLRIVNVNVGGTFLTAQLWLQGLRKHKSQSPDVGLGNVSLILIGSEAGHFGVRTCAPYAAAKSAVQGGMLQSLKADAPRIWRGARVNALAPGPVETGRFWDETGGPGTEAWWRECMGTTALGEPVKVEAVARAALWLASERWSGSVCGQVINVDGGKMGAVMWGRDELREKS